MREGVTGEAGCLEGCQNLLSLSFLNKPHLVTSRRVQNNGAKSLINLGAGSDRLPIPICSIAVHPFSPFFDIF